LAKKEGRKAAKAANKGTGNWEIEFFNSDRYNAARNRRAPEGYGADTPLT